MRYSIAVDRLRTIAETCTRLASLWKDDPLVVGAYVFGELLEGGQRPERLQLAFVVDLPPEEVTWYTQPTPMAGFAATVGIDKYPCEWYSRPALWPVWNHLIRGPVRFWALAGPDEPTLDALGDRRLGDLHRITPTAAEEAEQLQEELAASLAHLQRVDAAYWEREWRREHKGLGIYPEEHLWRASHGYLDLLAATRAAGSIWVLRLGVSCVLGCRHRALQVRHQLHVTAPGWSGPGCWVWLRPWCWGSCSRARSWWEHRPAPTWTWWTSLAPGLPAAPTCLLRRRPPRRRCSPPAAAGSRPSWQAAGWRPPPPR